jgi:internalin A
MPSETNDVPGNSFAKKRIELSILRKERFLDLSGLGITRLPDSLREPHQLERLDLRGNSLTRLPDWIGNLAQLQHLYVGGNELRDLPDTIGGLASLKLLDISFNNVTELPNSVGQLSCLERLDISRNDILRLPNSMGNLEKLQLLSASHNHLTALPESFCKLVELQSLSLDHNRLTTLPEAIGCLSQLRRLECESNDLAYLPDTLLEMPKLAELYLHANPRLGLAEEIQGARSDAVASRRARPARPLDILTFYFETRRASKPLNEVKLLLVGRGGSGKSSIRDRLLINKFHPQKKETPGIQIDRWPLDANDETVRVHVWDFAGQEITHATHQFFLTERSVYLLVLDARADTQDRDAEYWLRLISAFGKDSPVILALNKWNEKPFDLDRFALQEKYPAIRAFVPTDCKSNLGIKALQKQIEMAVTSLDGVKEPFPAVWAELKDCFSDMKANYLTFDAYRRECSRHGEKDCDRQAQLARILHRLGVILHYGDDPRLRDTTVLNPQWVTESIYTLLRAKNQPGSDGTLTLAEACTALPKESRKMVAYLLDLMRRFELCFPVDEASASWLVPELLPRFQPELGREWVKFDALRLRYEYKALPEGLVPRFITRTYPLSTGQVRWRNGVVLEMEGARALIRADPGAARVNVTICGDQDGSQRLAKLIRNHFSHIHADVRGLNPRELVEVDGHPGVFKSVATLMIDEQARSMTTVETQAGTVPINHTKELNRISAPAARDSRQRRLRVFLSYSHSDAKLRDVFAGNLALLEADGLIEWWFDGRVLPSATWDSEIRRELDQADIVICLLSTTYLESKYIQAVEMPRAMERRALGEAEIVSVLLEDCAWQDRPFTKFQMTQPGGKAVRRWARHRDAFNDVEMTLRKLIAAILTTRSSLPDRVKHF